MSKKNDINWGTLFAGAGAYKASSADKRLKEAAAKERERQLKEEREERQQRNIYKFGQGLDKILEMQSPEDRIECLEYMLNTAAKQINISVVTDIDYKDRYYETIRRCQEELKKAQDELTRQQIEKLEQEISDKSIIPEPVIRYQNLKTIGKGFAKINLLYLSGDKYKTRYHKAESKLSSAYEKIEKELGKERWNSIIELENSLPKLSNLLLQKEYKRQYTKYISDLTSLCSVIRQAHEAIPEYSAKALDEQLLASDKLIQAHQDAISMLKCMISLVKIHGEITEKQTKLILRFCKKISLNKEDFNSARPVADNFSFSENLPKIERIFFLLTLKKLMQSEPAISSSLQESFNTTCRMLGVDVKELPSGIFAISFRLKRFLANGKTELQESFNTTCKILGVDVKELPSGIFAISFRLKRFLANGKTDKRVVLNGNTSLSVEKVRQKRRLTYILLGILLGVIGVHNFYAGYTFKGLAQLLISTIVPPIVFIVFIWVIFELFTVKKDAKGVQFS